MKNKLVLACILLNTVTWNSLVLADTEKISCINIIKTHGFLSRAQFQCGFNNYSNEMIQSAKTCSQNLAKDQIEESLKSGMQTFDRNEKERGHNQMCQDILRDFPNHISK